MARSDEDTWDLPTSVGATATGVAVGRALASRAPDPLINDPFAEPLVRAVGVDFFTHIASGELDPDEADDGAGFGMTRMTGMMAVRTRLIDDYFADAGAAGVRQVVILASGLDARAYRLPWASGTCPTQPINAGGSTVSRTALSTSTASSVCDRDAKSTASDGASPASSSRACAAASTAAFRASGAVETPTPIRTLP